MRMSDPNVATREQDQTLNTFLRPGRVRIKTLDQYTNTTVIERTFSQKSILMQDRYNFKECSFQYYLGWTTEHLQPAANRYLYVFRYPLDYSDQPKLYKEYHTDNDGNIDIKYDVYPEERSSDNDRKPEDVSLDHIDIPFYDEGKYYRYYFWMSPFRISYPRIDQILEYIYENPETARDIFKSCVSLDMMYSPHLEEGYSREDNILNIILPDYYGYLIQMTGILKEQLEELNDFLNPTVPSEAEGEVPDEDFAKIKLFSDLIHNLIQKDEDLGEDNLWDYEEDKEEYEDRPDIQYTSRIDNYNQDVPYEWLNGRNETIERPVWNPGFDYREKQSFLKWRDSYDRQLKYYQEQAEITAHQIVMWLNTDEIPFAFMDLLYGTFSGAGTQKQDIRLPEDYDLETLSDYLYTTNFYDKTSAGNLFEALIGIVCKYLNQTERGQNFLRRWSTGLYEEIRSGTDTYEDYSNLIDDFLDSNRGIGTKDIMSGIFKTTRSVHNGFADIIGSVALHVITFEYSRNNQVQFREILQRTDIFFSSRRFHISFTDDLPNVTEIQANRLFTRIINRQGQVDICSEIESISFSANRYEIGNDLSKKISRFAQALDVVNLGLSIIQIISLTGKEELDTKDMLGLGEFAVDILSMTKITGTAVGKSTLGAVGAAVGAVTSGIDSYKQSQEGDRDSAIMYGVSSGISAASCGVFIASAIAAAAGAACAPVLLVIAIVAGIIAGIAAFIALFLDDEPIELFLAHCFWGNDFGKAMGKTTWSLKTDVEDWACPPKSLSESSLYQFVGNIDKQLAALEHIIYEFKLDDVIYYHNRPQSPVRRRRRPNTIEEQPLRLLRCTIEPGPVPKNAYLELEVILEDTNTGNTLQSLILPIEGGRNTFYNIDSPMDDYGLLGEETKLESITCFIADKSDPECLSNIRSFLAGKIKGRQYRNQRNMLRYHSPSGRKLNKHMAYIIDPKTSIENPVDLFSSITGDGKKFRFKVIARFCPNGQDKGEPIEKTEYTE